MFGTGQRKATTNRRAPAETNCEFGCRVAPYCDCVGSLEFDEFCSARWNIPARCRPAHDLCAAEVALVAVLYDDLIRLIAKKL